MLIMDVDRSLVAGRSIAHSPIPTRWRFGPKVSLVISYMCVLQGIYQFIYVGV